jgi:hypothetical protein
MDSERLKLAQQAVMAASQRVGSEERSSAFLAHSRMMVALYQAGQQLRRRSSRRR